ncbi:MAG: hypothetical protein ACP5QN_02565 [Minisyncoccia bacterium]
MNQKEKIGIIGLGIVGKTLFDWLKKKRIKDNSYKNFGRNKI